MEDQDFSDIEEAFAFFNKPKLNIFELLDGNSYKINFTVFVSVGVETSEEDFQQHFQNIDVDRDGLVSFQDVRNFLLTSQNQQVSQNQKITVEDMSKITKLYLDNSQKTFYQLRQIAKSQDFEKQFDEFFASATTTDQQQINEQDFQKIYAFQESKLFAINYVGFEEQKDLVSDSSSFVEERKIFGTIQSYLNEQGHQPNEQLNDAISVLIESDTSNLDQKSWKEILMQLKSKVEDVTGVMMIQRNENSQTKSELRMMTQNYDTLEQEFQNQNRIFQEINDSNQELRARNEIILKKFKDLESFKAKVGPELVRLEQQAIQIQKLSLMLTQSEEENKEQSEKIIQLEDQQLELQKENRQAKEYMRNRGDSTYGKNPQRKETVMRMTRMTSGGKIPETTKQGILQQARASVVNAQDYRDIQEITDELEKSYFANLQKLATSSKVSGEERAALMALSMEYQKYKEALNLAMESVAAVQQELNDTQEQVNVSEEARIQIEQMQSDSEEQIKFLQYQIESFKKQRDAAVDKYQLLKQQMIGEVRQTFTAVQPEIVEKAVVVKEIEKEQVIVMGSGFEQPKKEEVEMDFVDSDEDLTESADVVEDLLPSRDKQEADKNFDRILDELRKSRSAKQTFRASRPSDDRGSQVNDMILRASNLIAVNQQRPTLIAKTSNSTNFDYKHLRYQAKDNRNFKLINDQLTDVDQKEFIVFSEDIQQFDTGMNLSEQIILVTRFTIYIFSKKFRRIHQIPIRELVHIILITTNPCVFSLNFAYPIKPLLLQTFRRTELVVYLKSQQENLNCKSTLGMTQGLKLKIHGLEPQTIYFDKASISANGNKTSLQKKIQEKMQLNNFVNATMQGYLELRTESFFTKNWETKYFVLGNIGLVYFADLFQSPQDLFPVLDCTIKQLKSGDKGFKIGYQTFTLQSGRKSLMLRCTQVAEYEAWNKSIQDLLKQTQAKVQDNRLKEQQQITKKTR